MAVHKKKAASATKENVAPVLAKSSKNVTKTMKAKAAVKEAVKASQVKGKAKQPNTTSKGKKCSDDKDAEIAKLQAENASLRKASTEQEEPKIPCPPQVGRNLPLRTAMELDDDPVFYNAICRTVLRLADHAGLDHDTLWFNQPKAQIVRICQLAMKKQPYLKRFAHSWATEAILKTICKHRRDYARRPGVRIQGKRACGRKEDDENEGNRESDKVSSKCESKMR
ncbi:hypothetical protein M378DRAFT_178767 [Amanita muscaria Koide BX008]|uniref:Uncharacterized protein n=1 Tax=Amanita muscaria (strain Koide BX008) TaxID=946122 RepID=A0A0C2WSJ5_AMAMK|nr:hypothetical protein M378DRAFT_178767 [Amanita muscaria Koide BX008]